MSEKTKFEAWMRGEMSAPGNSLPAQTINRALSADVNGIYSWAPLNLARDAYKAGVASVVNESFTTEALESEIARLREVLKPLAEIDLTKAPPNDFAWFVLRARAVLSGESHD